MKQQRSTLEKRNPLEERKSGDAVGRPSRRSSLLGDPGEKFLGGKLKSSLNSVSTCLKVVDTRRSLDTSRCIHRTHHPYSHLFCLNGSDQTLTDISRLRHLRGAIPFAIRLRVWLAGETLPDSLDCRNEASS